MNQFIYNLWNRMEMACALDTDSPEERRHKVTLVVIAILCCIASIIWGTIYYIILGPTLTMFITYAFTLVVGTAVLIYFVNKRFALLLYVFFFMILWNPIAMQWSLGGFTTSGSIMIWSLLAPFGSLMFQDIKKATLWFLAYLVLIFVSLYLDAYSSQWAVPLSHKSSMLFFGMNTIGPSTTIFFAMMYFVNAFQKEHDRAEKLVLNLQETNSKLETTLNTLKKTQTELVQSEKMASLGQLTAGIAHEINNPIGAINSNIGMNDSCLKKMEKILDDIKERGNLNKLGRFFGILKDNNETIKTACHRISNIVNSLKNFARLDEADFQEADIHEGLDSTITLVNNEIKDRIEIIKEYGNIPKINCYPNQLNQAFMNVISNAIQAIPDAGKIFIKTKLVKKNIKVCIKDTGTGISEMVKRKIFEPFFTTRDIGKGKGLGLSISFGIIEKHKGKIEVESEEGRGTEFIITLPVK